MGIYYHLSCRDCRKTIQIGKYGGDGKNFGVRLSHGYPDMVDKLQKFLEDHENHRLFFSDDSAWSHDPTTDCIGNYDEIKWDPKLTWDDIQKASNVQDKDN